MTYVNVLIQCIEILVVIFIMGCGGGTDIVTPSNTASITGVVFEEYSSTNSQIIPAINAKIYIRSSNFNYSIYNNSYFLDSTLTDKFGKYRLTVPIGNYSIEGINKSKELLSFIENVNVDSGNINNDTIYIDTLKPASSIQGKISPLYENIIISIYTIGLNHHSTLDSSGFFLIDNIPEGRHSLRFISDNPGYINCIFPCTTLAGKIQSFGPLYGIIYKCDKIDSGVVPFDSRRYFPGETVTILNNIGGLSISGQQFIGWNIKSDASGKTYNPGDTLLIGNDNVILYAQWNDTKLTASEEITFKKYYEIRYSVNGDEYSQMTTDGGYITVGNVPNNSSGINIRLIKTTLTGDITWTKTYGGNGKFEVTEASSIQQTTDGGYIITGHTTAIGLEGDVYLLKTNAEGDSIWAKAIGGVGHDYGNSVQQTIDGGYIIVGEDGNHNIYLIKTNGTGDTIWTKIIGDNSNMDIRIGYCVRQTIDGGFIICSSSLKYLLIKTNAIGDIIWKSTFDDVCAGKSVQQTSDEGFIITGFIPTGTNTNDKDMFLTKTTSTGNILWTKTYGGSGIEAGNSVKQTTDGGYIIAGETTSFGTGGYDIYLVKTDSNGDTIWTKTFGETQFDHGYSVHQTSDGGFLISCEADSSTSGCLIKTDKNGNLN